MRTSLHRIAWLAALLLVPADGGAQVSLTLNRLFHVAAGGTATENCQTLRNALSSIGTAATAANSYLLRLEPGEYDCGSTPVVTKSFVDIEGAGAGVTRIFGSHDATSDDLGVLDLVDQVEIRSLTVENVATVGLATAVSATTEGESRIAHARLISDADAADSGCALFVAGPGAAGAGAVRVRVTDSTLRGATDGIFLQNGTGEVAVRGSTVEGGVDGVHLVSGDVIVLAHSELVGSYSSSGDLTCLYSYDGNLNELDSGCDPTP